ncbi:MAG: sulfatase-like hydrolase/transferase [Phycisphaeraceae bacterium]
MMNLYITRWLPVVLVFSMTVCGCASQPSESRPPNVILINADDLGYGDLSCYGATMIRTPNIDALAERGRRFTDAHSPSAVCSPSRYGLLTGQYPLRRNIWGPVNRQHPLVIGPDTPTLGKLFQQSGYDTACVGKWHLGVGEKQTDWNGKLAPGPNACGFDYYFGHAVVNSSPPYVYVENDGIVGYDPKDPIIFRRGAKSLTQQFPEKGTAGVGGAEAAHLLYRDKEVGTTFVEQSTRWINDRAKDQPYFLYLATTNIHHPFTPAQQFDGTSEAGIYGDFVHELDWMVGEIVKAVEARGELDNTLIIFTSDNGGMLNMGGQKAWEAGHRMNGDLLGFKFGIWEGGHRVPMIAAWPGRIPEGTTSDHLISQVDLFATLESLLNPDAVDAGAGIDSVNQLPELLGQVDEPIRDELVVLSNRPSHLAIRTARWLYIPAQGEGGFRGEQWGKHLISGVAAMKITKQINSDVVDGKLKADAPKAQLYDLINDPRQTRNVISEHAEVAKQMQSRVDHYRRQIGKKKPVGWIAPK